MKYIGIDIGTKNLAICILRHKHDVIKIKYWNVLDISGTNIHDIITNLTHEMNKITYKTYNAKHVYVEQQTNKNKYGYYLSLILETYFKTLKTPVHLISPKKKFEAILGSKYNAALNTTYRARKKYAILIVKEFLDETESSSLEYFNSVDKKDDLADALIICLKGMNYQISQ